MKVKVPDYKQRTLEWLQIESIAKLLNNNDFDELFSAFGTTSIPPKYLTLILLNSGLRWLSKMTYIPQHCFSELGMSTLNITEGIIKIYANAFKDCRNLETLYLPTSLLEISPDAFAGCEKLKEIYFNGSKSTWDMIVNRSHLYISDRVKVYYH